MPSFGTNYDANWVIFVSELWDNYILSVKLTANAFLQERLFPKIAG